MDESKRPARVTIIIPAYNAEAFIEASVRSILAQSFRNLRLIVVNDGSKDDTGAVLERLSREDSRLTVLNVPNGGPAMARNHGLDAVEPGTEYIMFADADDELAPDTVEYAVNNAGDADLVLMGFSIRNADGSIALYREPEQQLQPGDVGAVLGKLYKANLLNQVWAKLFRAGLILDNGIRFPDYRWGEDRLFIYDCLERAESVTVLPECKYCYIMHPGESLITRYYDKKPDVCLESDRRMQELCRRFAVEDEGDFRYMFVKSIFSCMTTLFSPTCQLTKAEKKQEIRRMLTDPQVQERSRNVFGGAAVKGLCAVLHTRCVWLNYAAFGFVAWVGSAAPRFFTKLKHRK